MIRLIATSLLLVTLLVGPAIACPTVDPNSTLYWAHNNFYDWTGFRADFVTVFGTWSEQASNYGYGTWYIHDIYDPLYANIWLTYGSSGEEDFVWGRCLLGYDGGQDGRITSFNVELNPVLPFAGGDPELAPPGQVALQSLLAHEIGHGFGAAHSNDVTSCTAFMESSWDDQLANLPTMVVGGQAQTWNWGLFWPFPVLYSLAPADLEWVSNYYQGVVEVEAPHLAVDVQDGVAHLTWPRTSRTANWVFEIRAYWDGGQDVVSVLYTDEPTWRATHDLHGVSPGVVVSYDLFGAPMSGTMRALTTVSVAAPARSGDTGLLTVSPNPFNPSVEISFSTDRPQRVAIKIFDLAGRCVQDLCNADFPAGKHVLSWSGVDGAGRQAPSGVYVVRMEGESRIASRKALLSK